MRPGAGCSSASVRSDRRGTSDRSGDLLLDGGLTFGVTGDYDQAPDIDVLCEGIERSMRELVAAAKRDGRTERVENARP